MATARVSKSRRSDWMYCGKLMKEVDLSKQGFQAATDCAFTDRSLYVVDYNGRKVYELSTIGKFIRIFATGPRFLRIAACQDRLYITTNGGGQNVYTLQATSLLLIVIGVKWRFTVRVKH